MNDITMKLMLSKIFSILLLALLVGCSTGPVEDAEEPDVPTGAGVFTGATGEFSLKEFFDEEKRKLASGGYYILDLDGAPPMTEEQFKEFEKFRAWLKAREEGTLEYKEYESWRAFQEYRKLQSQKELK